MDVIQKKYAFITGLVSIIFNVILFILKFWVGVISGSIALIADAWHTLSDSLTSIVLLFSVKLSFKPADKEHPYGHGRIELIGSIIIALFLGVVAFNFLISSIDRLFNHTSANYGRAAIIVTVISLISKEIMARYSIHIAKKINLRSLYADGWHHRSDAISSLIILLGIFMGKYFWWIDGLLGISVSGVLFYTTYDILRETISSFLGEYPDENFINEIKIIVRSIYKDDINIHHIHLHSYGYHKELTFHIHLAPDLLLVKAHEIATQIENCIRDQKGIETTIHIEPYH